MEDLMMDVYDWSSERYREEHTLIWSSPREKKAVKIVRLSVRAEKVILRVADSLCDDHPVRLHVEVAGGRYNGIYIFGAVRAIAAGTCSVEKSKSTVFRYYCKGRTCTLLVMPKCSNSFLPQPTWEIVHSHNVTFRSFIGFEVSIGCDRMTGLSAKFRRPFNGDDPTLFAWLKRSASLLRRQVNGKPPEDIIALIESKVEGDEYIICQGNTLRYAFVNGTQMNGAGDGPVFNANNNCRVTHGHGNNAHYAHCHVFMQNIEDPRGRRDGQSDVLREIRLISESDDESSDDNSI